MNADSDEANKISDNKKNSTNAMAADGILFLLQQGNQRSGLKKSYYNKYREIELADKICVILLYIVQAS